MQSPSHHTPKPASPAPGPPPPRRSPSSMSTAPPTTRWSSRTGTSRAAATSCGAGCRNWGRWAPASCWPCGHWATTTRGRRRKNIYRVMMDDPIHPLDAGRLQAALEARGKGASPMAQNAPYAAARMAQNEPREAQIEPGRAQNEPRGAQNELRGAQNEPALIDYSYSPKNIENTPSDAAPPPGAAGGGAPDPGLEAPPPPVPKERGRGRDKGAEAKRLLATADTPFAKAYRRRHGLPEPGE